MTGSIRLFVPARLSAGAQVAATAAQEHYLGAVMRRGVGDLVRLFNGQDGEWEARLARAGRGAVQLQALRQLREQAAEPGSSPDLWLAFALLKRDATDLVVQKATELGASAIWPVLTERTNAGRVNEARLAAIATEAAEQSERLTVPVIHPPRRLEALLEAWPDGEDGRRPLFAAIERSAAPFPPAARGPAALLVGPEGGFSTAELDGLRSVPFVIPVSLGPRVLRAETAAIAGLVLLQVKRGD